MKFSGELFTYDQDLNLVAFESGPKGSKQVVVFIGGLGDGLNALPCLEPLAETLDSMGWSLVQVQLGSSFNGYGTTNLQTDTKQLDTLVDFLKTQREKTRIVFLGHSTGIKCYLI
jgi:pimeloyl-ACP methyl ester carboxylesterase